MLLCRNPLKRLVLIPFILILFVHILTAQEEPANEELIFPIVATGIVDSPTHFQSTITFLEISGTTFEGRIEIFSDRGAPATSEAFCPNAIGVVVNPNISVAGNGLLHWSTMQERDLFTGWGRVVSEDPSSINQIQASIEVSQSDGSTEGCPVGPICNRPSTEILSTTQIPAVKPAREFRAKFIVTPPPVEATPPIHRKTAYAIVNPSASEVAKVWVRVLDHQGRTHPDCHATLELAPLSRISRFIDRIVVPNPTPVNIGPACFALPSHGSVIITSDIPIAVGAVDVLFPEGKFVGVPVEAR